MSTSLKKLWNEYGIGGAIVLAIVLYGLYMLYTNLSGKGYIGGESMAPQRNPAYGSSSSGTPQPALEHGNETHAQIGSFASSPPMASSSGQQQNPSDLLPKDNNSAWAQLNPAGKGDLSGINLLKAGYHIGIDTVGQTLRNANLQIRSEPPNPQVPTGPWSQSTIEPDFMRAPLEIGQGGQ